MAHRAEQRRARKAVGGGAPVAAELGTDPAELDQRRGRAGRSRAGMGGEGMGGAGSGGGEPGSGGGGEGRAAAAALACGASGMSVFFAENCSGDLTNSGNCLRAVSSSKHKNGFVVGGSQPESAPFFLASAVPNRETVQKP